MGYRQSLPRFGRSEEAIMTTWNDNPDGRRGRDSRRDQDHQDDRRRGGDRGARHHHRQRGRMSQCGQMGLCGRGCRSRRTWRPPRTSGLRATNLDTLSIFVTLAPAIEKRNDFRCVFHGQTTGPHVNPEIDMPGLRPHTRRSLPFPKPRNQNPEMSRLTDLKPRYHR